MAGRTCARARKTVNTALYGLAAHAHLVRVAVEPVLHRLENGLVLPPRDRLVFGRAALFRRRDRDRYCDSVLGVNAERFSGAAFQLFLLKHFEAVGAVAIPGGFAKLGRVLPVHFPHGWKKVGLGFLQRCVPIGI